MQKSTRVLTSSVWSSNGAIDDWSLLNGAYVEIYRADKLLDHGTVDAATQDGLIVWLSQEGATPRRLVHKEPGITAVVSTNSDGFSPPANSYDGRSSKKPGSGDE